MLEPYHKILSRAFPSNVTYSCCEKTKKFFVGKDICIIQKRDNQEQEKDLILIFFFSKITWEKQKAQKKNKSRQTLRGFY